MDEYWEILQHRGPKYRQVTAMEGPKWNDCESNESVQNILSIFIPQLEAYSKFVKTKFFFVIYILYIQGVLK